MAIFLIVNVAGCKKIVFEFDQRILSFRIDALSWICMCRCCMWRRNTHTCMRVCAHVDMWWSPLRRRRTVYIEMYDVINYLQTSGREKVNQNALLMPFPSPLPFPVCKFYDSLIAVSPSCPFNLFILQSCFFSVYCLLLPTDSL